MDRTCEQCGATLGEDSLFCTSCGAELKTAPGAEAGAIPQADKTSPIKGLRWKWVFISIGLILLTQLILGIIASIIFGIGRDESPQTAVIITLTIAGFFLGAMWAAYKSPGLTIKEPAVGSAIWVAVTNLVMRDVTAVIFGWVMPFLLALAGAKLGERLSRRKTSP